MSEPIILTERERAVFAELVSHLMGEANNRDTERAWQLGEVLRAWLRDMEPPTESASPPRVPGASAQFAKVGVQSGPGQPIDICERLEASASEWADQQDEEAILSRKAAAEIRRLRAESESRYRAGVEAAVRVECSCCRDGVPLHRFFKNMHVLPDGTERGCVAYRIRDLADKPPVDPLLAGLKYALQLIEDGQQSVYADSTWDPGAHRRSGDKYFVLLKAEIAARKGG